VRLLYVPTEPETLERLRQLAARERRRPQDQAALILERALQEDTATRIAAAPQGPEAA
jgi:hypothetical protein